MTKVMAHAGIARKEVLRAILNWLLTVKKLGALIPKTMERDQRPKKADHILSGSAQ
jgi:hypothetical protein